MKSIICGAGEVGKSIAQKLSNEGFEVTVVDESKENLKKISDNLDVKTVLGASSLPTILSSAGANECDILIAVTKSDETNMICCQIGHSLFNILKKRIREDEENILNKYDNYKVNFLLRQISNFIVFLTFLVLNL